jgi:hypothetical protein
MIRLRGEQWQRIRDHFPEGKLSTPIPTRYVLVLRAETDPPDQARWPSGGRVGPYRRAGSNQIAISNQEPVR